MGGANVVGVNVLGGANVVGVNVLGAANVAGVKVGPVDVKVGPTLGGVVCFKSKF